MIRTAVDTLIIGSGIAGLSAALAARAFGSVAVVTKAALRESNTFYAQGGVAVVTSGDDDVELHIADTIAAGAGLANADAVRVLCAEGPGRIHELMALGVAFDRNGAELARGLEAAHQRHRVLHAGGDATGAHIEMALVASMRNAGVQIYEHAMLTELITRNGAVTGARFMNVDGSAFSVSAAATVLASGGAGQLFAHTTNPAVATGDGIAAALRAGAAVRDMEFMQFHPTAAALPHSFLISEAVRGEGAVLRNASGRRFMTDIDARGELAPRDVVARGIAFAMAEQHGEPVVLDATGLGADLLARRFPTIDQLCRNAGIDWATTPVPVTPAAHYFMGGVATDLDGRTTLPGLFAVGEVANTGAHGANRLASNSLLEGLVFAHRAVKAIKANEPWPVARDVAQSLALDDVFVPAREELQAAMWEHAGLRREGHGLSLLTKFLTAAPDRHGVVAPQTFDAVEDANLAVLARVMAHAAASREESRGAHYRDDFTVTRDTWRNQQAWRQA